MKAYKRYEFRGQLLTLSEISKITGIAANTLKWRAYRHCSFEKPLPNDRRVRIPGLGLRLTGDMDRDLKAIITMRHRDVIRRHKQVAEAGLCEQCS